MPPQASPADGRLSYLGRGGAIELVVLPSATAAREALADPGAPPELRALAERTLARRSDGGVPVPLVGLASAAMELMRADGPDRAWDCASAAGTLLALLAYAAASRPTQAEWVSRRLPADPDARVAIYRLDPMRLLFGTLGAPRLAMAFGLMAWCGCLPIIGLPIGVMALHQWRQNH